MTSIPVEQLTTGTIIYLKGGDFSAFGEFATVETIEFDGGGYEIGVSCESWPDITWLYLLPGETVEFGGIGEPVRKFDHRDIYTLAETYHRNREEALSIASESAAEHERQVA